MKYFTLAFIFLATLTGHAQAPRGFYISAGLNQTSLESSDILANSGMGYRVGTTFQMGYHETFNYQMEIMYNSATLNILTVDQDYNQIEDSKYKYNTLDVNFYFNYYIIKPDEGKFFLGPQAGIGMSVAAGSVTVGGDENADKYYLPHLVDPDELVEMPPITLSAGVGLTGGYNDFRFTLRYNKGLSNILSEVQTNDFDQSNTYQGPELEGKVNSVMFTVSYRLFALFGSN